METRTNIQPTQGVKRKVGRPRKSNHADYVVSVGNLEISDLCALISNHVLRFKQITRDKSLNDKPENPFVWWHSPRKASFQAHILGELCSGNTILECCIACMGVFLKKYNAHFGTNVQNMMECDFEESIENWSKEKLLSEYVKLAQKVSMIETKIANPIFEVKTSQCEYCHNDFAHKGNKKFCSYACGDKFRNETKRLQRYKTHDNLEHISNEGK
jgi:hypothetical protein